MRGKTVNYILTSKETPVSYQVRPRALVNVEGKGLREILYIKGGHSIFKDDYDRNIALKITHVWFENGQLIINANDKLLIEYLEAHPDSGLRFRRNDPQADAQILLTKYKQRDQVKVKLSLMENFDALAEALARKDQSVYHLTPAEKELMCYQEAEKNPEKVLNAISDPATSAKYLVSLAINKSIVRANFQKTAVVWVDSAETIIPLPLGKRAIDVLGDFLLSKDGEGTLAELNLRLSKYIEGATKQDYKLDAKTSKDLSSSIENYKAQFPVPEKDAFDKTALLDEIGKFPKADSLDVAEPEVITKKIITRKPSRKKTATKK